MAMAAGVLAMFVACGISEVTDKSEDQVQQGTVDGVGSPFRQVCCVTGIDYPQGHDWTAEGQIESAGCNIVVFADGVPKMKIPVGDGHEVSREHDMHRMVDGNLYTFYSKDGRTVMKRNGVPLFRYDGDEVLMDIRVRGDDVFTLNHRRTGGGHSLRKNGELVLERLNGETFGRFWEDGDSLCYAFRQPVALADGLQERYYVVFESDVVPLSYDPDIYAVWDVMSFKGTPCSLVSSSSDGHVNLLKGRERRRIEISDSASILSGRMFPADSLIGVECMYGYRSGDVECGIWVEGSEYMRFETGSTISYLCFSDGRAYCALNPEGGDGTIFNAGEVVAMPEGYVCTGYQPLAVRKDGLYVALTSRRGSRPILWHDGRVDTLQMNGYVCSVSFTDVQEADTPR